jgi:hypothetical protein
MLMLNDEKEKERENLPPELRAIFDIIEESGEHGIDVGNIFEKLGKDGKDLETYFAVSAQILELREMGHIYKKIVKEEINEDWVANCIRWFVIGKGESLPEGSPMPFL